MADIEYFYSAHSLYAYLGSARLMEIAAAAGRDIVHKPFDLNRAIEAAGSIPFNERSNTLRSYHFRREAERCLGCDCPALDTCGLHHYAAMYHCDAHRFRGSERHFEGRITGDEFRDRRWGQLHSGRGGGLGAGQTAGVCGLHPDCRGRRGACRAWLEFDRIVPRCGCPT